MENFGATIPPFIFAVNRINTAIYEPSQHFLAKNVKKAFQKLLTMCFLFMVNIKICTKYLCTNRIQIDKNNMLTFSSLNTTLNFKILIYKVNLFPQLISNRTEQAASVCLVAWSCQQQTEYYVSCSDNYCRRSGTFIQTVIKFKVFFQILTIGKEHLANYVK